MIQTQQLIDYKHNFASWTASRAVQRDFTSTPIIRQAIEYSGLQTGIANLTQKGKITRVQYDEWHIETVHKLSKYLLRTLPKEKIAYGRVSKIVAIYIKTSHILYKPFDNLSAVAHVPVDRVLLDNLHRIYHIPAFNTKVSAWTKLSQVKYFNIIEELRYVQKVEKLKYSWMLEKYWDINR